MRPVTIGCEKRMLRSTESQGRNYECVTLRCRRCADRRTDHKAPRLGELRRDLIPLSWVAKVLRPSSDDFPTVAWSVWVAVRDSRQRIHWAADQVLQGKTPPRVDYNGGKRGQLEQAYEGTGLRSFEFRCLQCKNKVRTNLARLFRAADDATATGRDLYL